MKTNRRNFIKSGLATGLGVGLLGAGIAKAEIPGTCPPNLVQVDGEFHPINISWGPDDCEGYRLTFDQTFFSDQLRQLVRCDPVQQTGYTVPVEGWLAEWAHKHNGISILKVIAGNRSDKPHLLWMSGYRPRKETFSFLEARKIVSEQLNRACWTQHLVRVSFTIPLWAMRAFCTLPEGGNDDQAQPA